MQRESEGERERVMKMATAVMNRKSKDLKIYTDKVLLHTYMHGTSPNICYTFSAIINKLRVNPHLHRPSTFREFFG